MKMPEEETCRERAQIKDIVKPDISLMRYQADNIPHFEGTVRLGLVFAKIS